jgi:hypothetical protein
VLASDEHRSMYRATLEATRVAGKEKN